MEQNIKAIEAVMRKAPVIPVLTIENLADAVPLATALVAGGLPVIEVTLRTQAALEAIKLVADEVEGAIAGAGTVLTAKQLEQSVKAGSKFLVSPGTSPKLLDAAAQSEISLLPGVGTGTEAMTLGERGYRCMKFFPAGPAGGPVYLKSLGAPLPDFLFCPTGGVSAQNARDYLALKNVACVGGSWVCPEDLIKAGDWAGITALAKEASKLAA